MHGLPQMFKRELALVCWDKIIICDASLIRTCPVSFHQLLLNFIFLTFFYLFFSFVEEYDPTIGMYKKVNLLITSEFVQHMVHLCTGTSPCHKKGSPDSEAATAEIERYGDSLGVLMIEKARF